jgi:hypothetical protein
MMAMSVFFANNPYMFVSYIITTSGLFMVKSIYLDMMN